MLFPSIASREGGGSNTVLGIGSLLAKTCASVEDFKTCVLTWWYGFDSGSVGCNGGSDDHDDDGGHDDDDDDDDADGGGGGGGGGGHDNDGGGGGGHDDDDEDDDDSKANNTAKKTVVAVQVQPSPRRACLTSFKRRPRTCCFLRPCHHFSVSSMYAYSCIYIYCIYIYCIYIYSQNEGQVWI